MYRNYINPFYYDPYNTYNMYQYFDELRMSKGFIKMHHPFLDDMDDLERSDSQMNLMDYGPEPFAGNIEEMTLENNNYRTALWTGKNLQVTLMSINVGEDIGLEVHTTHDQFLRIEEGSGIVQMGDSRENLDFQRRVKDGFAIMVPAGKWHNVINTGDTPIKLYSIYAPPQHPRGTVHQTKAIAEAAEEAVN
ncbi:cupin domain-containing protein [Clostridium intestinale]|uniref:cupin domain-containing protein n=1 Tax=Clostridium intestinale TaxID=36845 RepID=UPI002DD65BEA|nr:cupin domain-containing protein [Clostridium intestinale]WRY49619.1 cupin domain-containing protein [Clostridium intestinale]